MRRIALLLTLLSASPSVAADPWHLNGWSARAIVDIPKPLDDKTIDTAAVKVLCQGRGKPDGGDYRVIDSAGKPVPFQLMFHDGARYSLISFRAADPRGRYFVYFGNPQATHAAEEVRVDPAPGAGAPKGAWVPKHGFVLQTIQRPEGKNPQTVAEMAKLIEGSTQKYGARYQRRVADGYNPFGPSDYYISIYRGWINIPKAGKYRFCTASNEASFSFLDGKELVHWPGRHTADRGARGEVNATVDLTAGLHYLEYYHEEVTLEQMAYLGWRPSGDEGVFSAIPESIYTAPHEAVVRSYETVGGKPMLAFEPVITDSVWPHDRSEGQYTRCRFRITDGSPKDRPPHPTLPPQGGRVGWGAKAVWDFGDGQTATGTEVEHVYLALGTYQVKLTAGGLTATWPLLVFELEHVTDLFGEGKPADYAKLAKSYDRNKLDAAGLRELAHLFAESDQPGDAVETGKLFLKRFPDAKSLDVARLRRQMAVSALRLGQSGLEEAVNSYQASIVKETPDAEKIDVLGQLIRLVGIERGQPDKALPFLKQAEETFKTTKGGSEVESAYRRALIAAGDVRLWQGQRDDATDLFARAEKLSANPPPASVRAALVGSYPNALREYLSAGNLTAALELIDKWEETFPTDRPKGHTFFWRGKVLSRRGQHREAADLLHRSIRLAVGADFETEARWLLAESLEKLGKKEEAKRELAKLIATGLSDEFTKKAKEKLK
jgi:tetratricopeptide (TPR) repeat protein